MPTNLRALLTISAIIVAAAVMVYPIFREAREADGDRFSCLANIKQFGVGMQMYMADFDDRVPDRRDLKSSLPGGYRPWTGWPATDPRAGWMMEPMYPYFMTTHIWKCPDNYQSAIGQAPQVHQETNWLPEEKSAARVDLSDGKFVTCYWMWGFDKKDKKVTLDNFWGKKEEQILADLQTLNQSHYGFSRSGHGAGYPESEGQVEVIGDPYFPVGAGTEYDGVMPHTQRNSRLQGRNVGYLDTHAKFVPIDPKTNAGAGPDYLSP